MTNYRLEPLNTQGVDKTQLGPTATEHFEARVFQEKTPEYLSCTSNATAMLEFVDGHKMARTAENFEKAYTALRAEGKLLVPGSQALQLMTAAEYQQFAEQNGTPRFLNGKLTGYDLPHELNLPPAETENSPHRLRKSQMKYPELYGYEPTKAEMDRWSAEKFDEWAKANGHWGRQLPEYLL